MQHTNTVLEAKEHLGCTVAELAILLQVREATVLKYLRGSREPKLRTWRMALVLREGKWPIAPPGGSAARLEWLLGVFRRLEKLERSGKAQAALVADAVRVRKE